MNIQKIISIAAIVGISVCTGCKDFLDINNDPTRIDEQSVTLAALLPTCIEATAQANHQISYNTSQVTQYVASVAGGGVDAYVDMRVGDAWSSLYLTAMTNLNLLIKKANNATDFSPHYAGVAKVLMAYNLASAASVWENVPFSEAFSLSNLKPAYDSQEAIYNKVDALLAEAITDLNVPQSSKSPGADDIIHAGNRTRWKAAATALRARYALHKSSKGAVNAATAALTFLAKDTLLSNTDDLQLVYNTRNLNPWHTRVALANNTGNFTVSISAQLADAMNGTSFGTWDPRLPVIAGRLAANVNATTWIGKENGSGAGGNLDLTATAWHSRNTAPVLLMTYAEQQFIKAEAEFLKNGGTSTSTGTTAVGYAAYLNGIRANLDKLAVADTAKTRYMADSKVAVGAANLTLQLIMGEKYKAQFLNPETWNDMRRWNYSNTVFKDLDFPRNQNPSMASKWIQRSSYPFDEFSRNGTVAKNNEKPLDEKMWIFKP